MPIKVSVKSYFGAFFIQSSNHCFSSDVISKTCADVTRRVVDEVIIDFNIVCKVFCKNIHVEVVAHFSPTWILQVLQEL